MGLKQHSLIQTPRQQSVHLNQVWHSLIIMTSNSLTKSSGRVRDVLLFFTNRKVKTRWCCLWPLWIPAGTWLHDDLLTVMFLTQRRTPLGSPRALYLHQWCSNAVSVAIFFIQKWQPCCLCHRIHQCVCCLDSSGSMYETISSNVTNDLSVFHYIQWSQPNSP